MKQIQREAEADAIPVGINKNWIDPMPEGKICKQIIASSLRIWNCTHHQCELPQKANITLLYSRASFIRFSIMQLFRDPHTLCGNYIDAMYNKVSH